MTPAEQAAFNAGIATMAALTRAAADAMRPRAVRCPLRYERAISALDAIADEADGLIKLPLASPAPSDPPGLTGAVGI